MKTENFWKLLIITQMGGGGGDGSAKALRDRLKIKNAETLAHTHHVKREQKKTIYS